MAERQHTTGKASSKGVKHVGKIVSSKGVKHASGIVNSKGANRTAGIARRRPKSAKSPSESVDLMYDVREALEVIESRGIVKTYRKSRERLTQATTTFENRLQEGESTLQNISDLLGGSQTLGSAINSDLEAHELLHQGLPRAALSSLVDKLHVIEVTEASAALGMSLRTLQRHKSEPDALLDVPQSGRAWTFAEILAKATRVLGSQDEAEQWLRRPAIGLDQQRPIDLLTTPAGVKLVEDYLGRLEYNVYT